MVNASQKIVFSILKLDIIPKYFQLLFDHQTLMNSLGEAVLRVSRFLHFLQLLCHKNAPNQSFMF
jgi:hypothetical protein